MGFPTNLIVAPTCFALGIIFCNWAADHDVLYFLNVGWTHDRWVGPVPSSEAVGAAEAHYLLLAKSPRIMSVMLHAVIGVGIFGHFVKLWKANESNYLFDGASLVLYMIAVVLYGTSVITGLRSVSDGQFGELTKVDTLRVVAATHVILAVVLIGVLLLQGGQWYAEAAELRELKEIEAKEREEAKKLQ